MIFLMGESIETPQPLNKNKRVKLKKQLSCLVASVILFDVLRNLEDRSERKSFSDFDLNWKRNLLIWSQRRYHCATKWRDRFCRVLCNVDIVQSRVSISFGINTTTHSFLRKNIFLQSQKVVIQASFLAVDFFTSRLVLTNSLIYLHYVLLKCSTIKTSVRMWSCSFYFQ